MNNINSGNLSAEFTANLISLGLKSSQISKIEQGLITSKIHPGKCSLNEIIEWAARNDIDSCMREFIEGTSQTDSSKSFSKTFSFDEIENLASQKNRFFEQLLNDDPGNIMKLLKKELCLMRRSKNEAQQEYLRVLQEEEDLKENCFLATRSIIFKLLDNLLTIRARKNAKIDAPALENLLMEIFSLKILSKNQNQRLYKKYMTFLNKINAEPSLELVAIIENFNRETTKGSNFKSKNPKISQNKIEKTVKKTKQTKFETENVDDLVEGLATSDDIYERDFRDLCVICMHQQREIVYLPCAHLLTCKSCGPLLDECPICTQKVEKKLKIYWS